MKRLLAFVAGFGSTLVFVQGTVEPMKLGPA